MARYIDADKLEKDFPQSVSKHNVIINGNEYPVFLVDHVLHKIRNYPAADVVEVVRCERCLHANADGTICHYGVGRAVDPTHFCSYGERRDT